MAKLVQGIGFNDGSRIASVNKVINKEYVLWQTMLCRLANNKRYPTYSDCGISDNFKSYSYFYDWCQNQVGFNSDGFDMDKDILIKGNKIYSEDTCMFVPHEINRCFIRTGNKGRYPIGVTFNKMNNKFIAFLSKNHVKTHIGCFDNEANAFYAYKTEKEDYIKSLAIMFVGQIDERIYNVLMNYVVEIDD